MTESLNRVATPTPTDERDELTKNPSETQPSLTSGNARARIRRNPMIRLSYSAACLWSGQPPCAWTWTGPDSDRAAERHVKAEAHPTVVGAVPTEEPAK